MKEFKSIDDFIIPGRIRIVDPEAERKINEYMERLHRQAIIDEFEAIKKAREILLI